MEAVGLLERFRRRLVVEYRRFGTNMLDPCLKTTQSKKIRRTLEDINSKLPRNVSKNLTTYAA